MSIIENYQQEQRIKEEITPTFTLATVAKKYDDGVSLIFPGSSQESQKHYKYNIDANLSSGDLVYVTKDSGTYIVICRIGKRIGTLPPEYTKLEYIKSSGSQYINTGFTPTSNTKIIMYASVDSHPSNGSYFGARSSNSGTDSGSYCVLILTGGTVRSDFYGDSKSLGDIPIGKQKLLKNKNETSLSEASVIHPMVEKESAYPLYLFCINTSGTASVFGYISVYSCKIYDNNIIVRDYIPCISPDGEVGMYDLAESKFYKNNGTGNFTYE